MSPPHGEDQARMWPLKGTQEDSSLCHSVFISDPPQFPSRCGQVTKETSPIPV